MSASGWIHLDVEEITRETDSAFLLIMEDGEEVWMPNDSSDCPGRWKCHGPASYCAMCGDVDLVCDDPECDVHMRTDELRTACDKSRERFNKASKEYESAKKELRYYSDKVFRHVFGNVVMVARGKRS